MSKCNALFMDETVEETGARARAILDSMVETNKHKDEMLDKIIAHLDLSKVEQSMENGD